MTDDDTMPPSSKNPNVPVWYNLYIYIQKSWTILYYECEKIQMISNKVCPSTLQFPWTLIGPFLTKSKHKIHVYNACIWNPPIIYKTITFSGLCGLNPEYSFPNDYASNPLMACNIQICSRHIKISHDNITNTII